MSACGQSGRRSTDSTAVERLTRIIFNGLTLLSLVGFVATASLWMRGFWREYILYVYPFQDRTVELTFGFGRNRNLFDGLSVFTSPPSSVMKRERRYPRPHRFHWNSSAAYENFAWGNQPGEQWRRGAFSYAEWTANGSSSEPNLDLYNAGDRYRRWTWPTWLLPVLALPLPIFWAMRRMLRRRRPQDGLCPLCGYDLRASKEVCPECGRPILLHPKAIA